MTLTLKLTDKETVLGRVALFTFEDANGDTLPAYSAGAHVDFDLGETGTRSYSLINFSLPAANAPSTYQIAVQCEEDGDGGSKAMHALEPGAIINTSMPKNDFALHEGDAPAILIAGGIGVTPIISFATDLTSRAAKFQFHYATRSQSHCTFKETLETRFKEALTLWFDDSNQIDLTQIIANAPDDAHIYCCGPKGMIEAVREIAETNGYDKSHIHFELFASPAGHDGDTPFEVEINDGRVFTIPSDKSIVDVLEEAGVDIMYDCQRGDCGICQCDVISGEPDHRDVVLSESERAAGDVIQICVSRAKSARLVLDI